MTHPAQSNSDLPKPLRILIVEDERIIALNTKENLENLGYVVPAIAASGEKAIEKATELHPDLVLMDIRLKGAMDGIEAAEKIWNTLQIPVIYITGHSDQSTLERAKFTSPFGYILKPVKERELYVAIETALQRYEREQLLMAVLRSMGDGVIVTDVAGQVKFLNQVAEILTGWRSDEVKDRPITEVFKITHEQSGKSIDALLTAALQQNTPVYLEDHLLLHTRTGNTVPIADSIAVIKDNMGNVAGAVLVFRDITQRRLAEEQKLAVERARYLEVQMRELQRLNQLKDDFLSTVSHELRTPLANIQMAIRMLTIVLDRHGVLTQEEITSASSVTRYLNMLNEQCEQEMDFINDLLEMRAIDAEIVPLETVSVYLQHWIPHVVEGFQERVHNQQQTLQIDVPADLPPLLSELSSLTRIFSELLNNACKYTPPEGKIMISAQLITETPIEQIGELFLSTPYLQLQISNSGVEIPPAELSRIFEPFYRIPNNDPWKYGGTGLGLALVKKLVHRIQGAIAVTSRNDWTTFSIQLPWSI
jgi:PAS domain S-box-containing protein